MWLTYTFDARHLVGGLSARARRTLPEARGSWALHHGLALLSSSMSNAACWLGRVRVAGGNLPSRVASDRVVNTLEHLRLVSSCQKLHDNIALHLALAAEILLIPCKTPALDRRVCKQRLQSDLRTRIPAPSSRRKLRSKFRVGVEVGLPVLCIVPQAQPREPSTAMTVSGRSGEFLEWRCRLQ